MAEVEQQQQDVKLFNRWTFEDVQVREWLPHPSRYDSLAAASCCCERRTELSHWHPQVNDISLNDYLAVSSTKHATYLPHTAGRYSKKRFRKAQCPIVERLTNSLMMHGRNNGKKVMAVRIIKHTLEIIHLLTDANPIQVVVDAIINRYRLTLLPSLPLIRCSWPLRLITAAV